MKDLEKKKYWIWLSLISDLGSRRKQELLRIYGNPKIIYELKEDELICVKGIGEKTVKNILDRDIRNMVQKHMEFMTENNIDIISISDEEYPPVLREIYDPPISLYCKGDCNILKQKSIAIVGCRDATEYGKSVAKYFAYHLAKQNINVISGLAKGIDSYAHIGTMIGKGGKTVAVLGNGLDMIYPKENGYLAKKIIEQGGAILSEYPLGTKPAKMNFPARNRIISGMSEGILVVEAKEKSGTLLTVDFALEQGRDVFVVPGNINSVHSIGTNRLIQQGAKLVTHYRDIA